MRWCFKVLTPSQCLVNAFSYSSVFVTLFRQDIFRVRKIDHRYFVILAVWVDGTVLLQRYLPCLLYLHAAFHDSSVGRPSTILLRCYLSCGELRTVAGYSLVQRCMSSVHFIRGLPLVRHRVWHRVCPVRSLFPSVLLSSLDVCNTPSFVFLCELVNTWTVVLAARAVVHAYSWSVTRRCQAIYEWQA